MSDLIGNEEKACDRCCVEVPIQMYEDMFGKQRLCDLCAASRWPGNENDAVVEAVNRAANVLLKALDR